MQQARDFLSALWPDEVPGHLAVFRLDRQSNGRRVDWCETTDDVLSVLERERNKWECYVGCCAQDRAAAEAIKSFRGRTSTTSAIPAVWVDIDVDGEGHRGNNVCRTMEDAVALAHATGITPSFEIETGGGLQAWWLLDEPMEFNGQDERDYGAFLAGSWIATMQEHAKMKGFGVDSVGDLARILRLPDSFNLKIAGKPRPVRISEDRRTLRYTPSDLESVFLARVRPRTVIVPVGECSPEVAELAASLMPHISSARADVYAEWIKVGMTLKATGGDALRGMFHEFSKRSPAYDECVTDAKWDSFVPEQVSMGSLIHMAHEDSKGASKTSEPIGSAWQIADESAPIDMGEPEWADVKVAPNVTKAVAEATKAAPEKAKVEVQADPTASREKPAFANVIDMKSEDGDGEEKNAIYFRRPEDIAKTLHEATGGWPKRVGNMLFSVEGKADVNNPQLVPIQYLTKPDQFAGWTIKHCDVRWHTGNCKQLPSKAIRQAPSKTEFFEFLKANTAEHYESVEILPHHPIVRGVYYVESNVPTVAEEDAFNSPLWQLINAMNPETEQDRLLMLAAMMTPGWGGPCGARPAFIFTSEHGRGCVAGETKIFDANSGEYRTIESIYDEGRDSMGVLSVDDDGNGVERKATAPFIKGVADLYEVRTAAGHVIRVTDQHRFLTPEGWRKISDGVAVGSQLGFAPGLHPSNSDTGLEASLQGVQRLTRTLQGSLDDYLACPRCGDERLPSEEDGDQASVRPPSDALGRSLLSLPEDDRVDEAGRTHLHHAGFRHAKSSSSLDEPLRADGQFRLTASEDERVLPCSQAQRQSRDTTFLDREVHEPGRSENETSPQVEGGWCPQPQRCTCVPSASSPRGGGRSVQGQGRTRKECGLPGGVFSRACINMVQWTRVVSITFVRRDRFFDLHVPGTENYLAEGLWNHNTGKTQTASTISELWGGNMTVTAGEDWDTVRKRLLGDESMAKRVILIDNLKGKLNSGDIEAAITSKNIDGWKPYHGQASRPNRLTWFITANSPNLSRDLADRSIIIKIGKQKHGTDFTRWAGEFIEAHRPQILAELFAILKREPVCEISGENRDRWQAWQDAILSRLDDGDDLARLIVERRPDVDADLNDADEISESLMRLLADKGYLNHEACRILVSFGAAFDWLWRNGVCEKSLGRRGCAGWLRNMAGQGSLSSWKMHKTNHSRGLLYTGPMWNGQDRTHEILEPTTGL